MHALNQYIGYCDEDETLCGSDHGGYCDAQKVVIEGDALNGGADVVRNLRLLNNYFSAAKRKEKFTRIQDANALSSWHYCSTLMCK